jgi:hypothetical protein
MDYVAVATGDTLEEILLKIWKSGFTISRHNTEKKMSKDWQAFVIKFSCSSLLYNLNYIGHGTVCLLPASNFHACARI